MKEGHLMSEDNPSLAAAARASAAEAAGSGAVAVTAGSLLRSAREAAGLHVAALAVAMKVPVKKLEALEADRLDLLPDAVFVRALASSVCRSLKIDATPVLERLPQTTVPKLDTEQRGINTPFHASGTAHRSTAGRFGRPTLVLVFILLLGVLAVLFFPEVHLSEHAAAPAGVHADPAPAPVALMPPNPEPAPVPENAAPMATAAVETPGSVPAAAPGTSAPERTLPDAAAPAPTVPAHMATVPAVPAHTAPVPVAEPANAAPGAAAAKTAPAGAVGVAAVRSVSGALAPASSATAASSAAGPAMQVAAGGVLSIRASGATWVSVSDAQGGSPLRRTLEAGEVISVSGATPLAVVVGNVDVTRVEVRGKPFNLSPYAKDNVARFEVK